MEDSMPDSKTPTPGEITIMAGGGVALIGSFLHFYTLSGASYSASAWSSGFFPVATLMVIFTVISAVLIALTKFANVQLPERVLSFTWTQIYLVLGFFAALYAVAFLITDKSGRSFGIGFWLILIGCVASLVGAILLLRERATSGYGGGAPGAPPTA
jgi:hypothetical protein